MRKKISFILVAVLVLSMIPVVFGQAEFDYNEEFCKLMKGCSNDDCREYALRKTRDLISLGAIFDTGPCKKTWGPCLENARKEKDAKEVEYFNCLSECNEETDYSNSCYQTCNEKTYGEGGEAGLDKNQHEACVRLTDECVENFQPQSCPGETKRCSDSDSGKNYFQKGIVDVADFSGNIVTSREDSCEGDILLEQYCENNQRKEEVYNCNVEEGKCIDGACTQIKFEYPVFLRLQNPPYEILMDPAKGQYIGQVSDSDSKAVLMAHPKIFSERKIIDYNKGRDFYRRDEWNIITEYDPLIAFANVYVSDKNKEVSIEFSLQGETKAGACKRWGNNPDTEGYLTWLCSAEFDAQTNKRGEKMNVKVTASVDDKEIETTTNDVVIARFVYPVTRIRGPPNVVTTSKGEKYQEEQTIKWGNIAQQVDYFIKLSGLAKTGSEMLESPKKSYKFVYYHAGSEPLELSKNDVYEEIGKEKVIKDSIGSVVANKLGFQSYYNAEKDKIVLVSDYIVDKNPSAGYGFSYFSIELPKTQIDFIAVRPKTEGNTVLAHEFGHVYGPHFCEEYSYLSWLNNNKNDIIGGCKNPFPSACLLEIKDAMAQKDKISKFERLEYIDPFVKIEMVSERGELVRYSTSYSKLKNTEIYKQAKGRYIKITKIIDFDCIKGTTVMGKSPITYERYPEGGECPIGSCQ